LIPHPVTNPIHLKRMPNQKLMERPSLTLELDPAECDNSPAPVAHPLDNPIWNSLHTEHRSFAVANALARRYPPAVGPLSGIARQSAANYEALRELAGPGGVVVLFCQEKPAPPPGWTLVRGGVLSQMVCAEPADPVPMRLTGGEEFRSLTAADVPEMFELATLTEPGPFRERTIELGPFFGIFQSGRLLAMAGQRTHLPQFVEVSAVCTHPDARGRGYARMLIATVMDEIRQRGKTPYLHSFADHYSAIRVYESLGFTLRRNLELAVLKNDG
jgi:GNAT superfamily N-acetyltransferase